MIPLFRFWDGSSNIWKTRKNLCFLLHYWLWWWLLLSLLIVIIIVDSDNDDYCGDDYLWLCLSIITIHLITILHHCYYYHFIIFIFTIIIFLLSLSTFFFELIINDYHFTVIAMIITHTPYMYTFICIHGTPMASIFEGQPPKTRPDFQQKQGSFGFQLPT